MPVYAWKAITSEGKAVAGKSQAIDLNALTIHLEQSGQLLLKANVVKPGFSIGKQKVGREQLLNFSFQLSMIMRAGVTILESSC